MDFKILFNQIITYAPGSIISALIGLLSTTIFARLLGKNEFGRYSLVIGIVVFLTTLSVQWLQQSINRYLPAQSDAKSRIITKGAFVLGIGMTFIFLLCFSTVVVIISIIWLENEWLPYIISGSLLVLCLSIYSPLLVILQAESSAKEHSIFNILNNTLKFILGVAVVWHFSRRGYGAILGTSLGTIILIPSLWRIAGFTSKRPYFKMNTPKIYYQELKKYFLYGLPMVGWFLGSNLLNTGDRYIIQWYHGTAEVGIYSANYSLIVGAVIFISNPILLAAHPFLMKSWGAGNNEETRKWLGFIIEWFMYSGLILVTIIWLFSKDISSFLLGSDYKEGHTIMPLVLAGFIIMQMAQYLHKPLEFTARTSFMMILALIAALVGVVLNIILISQFGYIGAAWATFASYLLYAILVGIVGKKILAWEINWKKIGANSVLLFIGSYLICEIRFIVEVKIGYIYALLTTCLLCFTMIIGSVKYSGIISILKKAFDKT